MKPLRHIAAALAMTALCAPAVARDIDSLRYEAEVMTNFSGGASTPFWFTANRYGLASVENSNGYLRGGVFLDLNPKRKGWSYGFGADVAVAYRFPDVFNLQQLYGEVSYWNVALTIGQKEVYDRLNNRRLSTGDLLYSGNARPIPQIRVQTNGFIDIPGTKRLFAMKGYASVGIFTDDRWQRDFSAPGNKRTERVGYLDRGIGIRIGNKDVFPLSFEGGLEVGTQWGGTMYKDGKKVKVPDGFKDFVRAALFLKGSATSPWGENANVNGNQVGEWSARLSWQQPGWGVSLYYEHLFEDQSMMFFDFLWKDMLIGIEGRLPKNRFVSNAVYEFMYSKDQSGPVFWDHKPGLEEQVSGNDDYYNHSIYSGWQNWGFGIGNPIFVSPIFNKDGNIIFRCNRLITHHFALEGDPLPYLNWRLLCTFTSGWGTYERPFKNIERDFSTMIEVNYNTHFWKGFTISLAGAFDRGKLLGNSSGVMLTLRKTGKFF